LLGSVGEGHLRRNGGEEELSRHRLCTQFPWLKGKQAILFFSLVSLEAILATTTQVVISLCTPTAL